MEIIDAIKTLKGKPAEIPDSSRNDLPEFFVEMGYKVGAEIGVYKGAFSQKLCRAGLKVYAIDHWWDDQNYHPGRANFQQRQDIIYKHARKTLTPFPNCTIVKKTSMEAVNDYKDASLDFVHIDGNHRFRYVSEDICEWSKKVRSGGVVSGHCYLGLPSSAKHDKGCQSKYVVDAYAKAFNIKNWYLIGRVDGWLSWFWIK